MRLVQQGDGSSTLTPPLQFSKKNSPPFWIKEIGFELAAAFVLKYHYSKVMPRQTKICLGFYKGEKGPLVGVMTLGWGVRPKDTIRRLFPSLNSKDYLEIGKLCVVDSEPKNSESRILSLAIWWLRKNRPDLKVLFTWADALWGKPGYIYQAANFYYGGHIWTEVYMDKNGVRFHPRQLKAKMLSEGMTKSEIRKSFPANNEIGCGRPKKEQLAQRGWKQVFGMQFRYVYFLCGEEEKNKLLKESETEKMIKYDRKRHGKVHKNDFGKIEVGTRIEEMTVKKSSIRWLRPNKNSDEKYPKEKDLEWEIRDGITEEIRNGRTTQRIKSTKPQFTAAFDPNRI